MKWRHFFFAGDESFDEKGLKHAVSNEAKEAWALFVKPVLIVGSILFLVAVLGCSGVFFFGRWMISR